MIFSESDVDYELCGWNVQNQRQQLGTFSFPMDCEEIIYTIGTTKTADSHFTWHGERVDKASRSRIGMLYLKNVSRTFFRGENVFLLNYVAFSKVAKIFLEKSTD